MVSVIAFDKEVTGSIPHDSTIFIANRHFNLLCDSMARKRTELSKNMLKGRNSLRTKENF